MLKVLRREGATVLFISHKLREVMEIADRITVMRRGRIVATRNTCNTGIDELTELMVGSSIELQPARKLPTIPSRETILQVKGLTASDDRGVPKLRGVSLDLDAGEIHGLAGGIRQRPG